MGHTHGPVDQRFSVIRSILSLASRLEVPKDFADCLLNKMHRICNRELIVEVTGNTYDFSKMGAAAWLVSSMTYK